MSTIHDAQALLLTEAYPVPNNRLPVLLYRNCVPADPAVVEALFASHGWSNTWRNGIFPFHHFHSTAHEVLGCARGFAEVRLGGEPGTDVRLNAGDVVVLPAGTGHKRLTASEDLLIIGAYPDGRDYDLIRADAVDRAVYEAAVAQIAIVPRPETDPVLGHTGPLCSHWQPTRSS